MSEEVKVEQLAKIFSMSEDDVRQILEDALYDEEKERRAGFFEVIDEHAKKIGVIDDER